jgi:hypothetical protein
VTRDKISSGTFYQTKKNGRKKRIETMNIRPCSPYLYLLLFILTLTVALLADKQQHQIYFSNIQFFFALFFLIKIEKGINWNVLSEIKKFFFCFIR